MQRTEAGSKIHTREVNGKTVRVELVVGSPASTHTTCFVEGVRGLVKARYPEGKVATDGSVEITGPERAVEDFQRGGLLNVNRAYRVNP